MDTRQALGAFLNMRYPDSEARPAPADLLDALLEPGYSNYDDLAGEWRLSERKGLVPEGSRDFATIFEAVHNLLEAAVAATFPPGPRHSQPRDLRSSE